MSEGGVTAVGSDEAVVGNSEVRKLEERVRELERRDCQTFCAEAVSVIE
jgi:hypothetical protein